MHIQDIEELIVKVISWYFILIGVIHLILPLRSVWSISGSINLFAPLGIIAGIGILRLKDQARKFGMTISAVTIFLAIKMSVVLFSALNLLIALVYISINAYIIYFLSRHSVRVEFL